MDPPRNSSAVHGLALAVLLAIVFALYALGFSGSFHFDDAASLKGLAAVADVPSAIDYVFGGATGPTGRPLALASFLPQADAWPEDPSAFLRVNALIHCFNGLLVYGLVLALLRLRKPTQSSPQLIALIATALWLIAPLHASATLMAVQRMTLLSGTFVLAGLLAYLVGLSLLASRRRTGLVLMSSGIAVGTVLAALAKENGALLPIYALVLTACLLQRTALRTEPAVPRAWSAVFLYAPLLLLACYFVFGWPGIASGYLHRDFTPMERLLTEAEILWRYLGLLFAPRPLSLTPFLDNYPPLSPGQGLWVYLPALAWAAAIATAFATRRRFALFAFAVLWYVAGHSIESGVIPLELYFEHRNYLPVLGPLLAGVLAVDHLPRTWRRILHVAIAVYALLIASVLAQTTSLWGEPDLAGELWLIENRDSVRAAKYLAERYLRKGDMRTHAKILDEAHSRHPDDTSLAVQHTMARCAKMSGEEWQQSREALADTLATGNYHNATTRLLDSLVTTAVNGGCPALRSRDVYLLADSLLRNPHFRRSPTERHNILMIKFRLGYLERNYQEALNHALAAYAEMPDLETLRLITEFLISVNRADAAIELLARERPRAQSGFLATEKWRRRIDELAGLARNQ